MNNTEFKQAVIAAVDKVIEQGQLGRNGGGSCYYTMTTADGKEICCPVGHMMPSTETREEAENHQVDGGSIGHISEQGFPWAQQFSAAQMCVLIKLQEVHDGMNFGNFINFKELINEEIVPMLDKLCSQESR